MILENEQIIEVLRDTGWVLKGRSITKNYKFGNFNEAMDFVNNVAGLAEEKNHHPNIEISYDRVKLTLSNHEEGGVSDKDISMAIAIDEE